MFVKLVVLNCLLIYVICDDLIIPGIPKISVPKIRVEDENSSNFLGKKHRISGQKHVLSAGGSADIEKKAGNAEKVSNYEKDKGFFFMKAYGWDREKKNEHLNAEGKLLKASKGGKIFKEDDNFNKKLNEKYKNDDNKNYGDLGPSLKHDADFAKRIGFSKPINQPYMHKEFKFLQPEVEYTEGPATYEIIEPRTNYYPNKEYTRIHYPVVSGTYLPSMHNRNTYQTYKNSRRYPDKDTFKNNLWNQGYHATKYYNKPVNEPVDENLVEYYEKSKYEPMGHITRNQEYPSNDHYSDDKYSNDDEDEGRHYYDRKMTNFEIDKLRESYSKYNDDYAGSQLLPQKVYLETPIEQPKVKKRYRLWTGSQYY